MKALAGTGLCAIVAGFFFLSSPAAAFFSLVEPSLKVGADCLERVSLLAPKLTTCAVAGARTRIWCPDGKMCEGPSEDRGVAAALARSLCNMAQLP